MNELDHLPSLQAFGRRLDELAARDAHDLARFRSRASRRSSWSGALTARLAIAVGLLAVLVAGLTAVPATRAAIDDVYGAFSSWVTDDATPVPGRPVAAGDDVPTWVAAEDGEKRILATAGGETMVALRQGDEITLALKSFAETATVDSWRRRFEGRRLALVGPGSFLPNGRHDRRPLFGLIAASVTRVRFTYRDGGVTTADDLDGAFGIVIDTDRRPRSIAAYDETGALVGRLDFVTDRRGLRPDDVLGDFRYCPWRGCRPWRS